MDFLFCTNLPLSVFVTTAKLAVRAIVNCKDIFFIKKSAHTLQSVVKLDTANTGQNFGHVSCVCKENLQWFNSIRFNSII